MIKKGPLWLLVYMNVFRGAGRDLIGVQNLMKKHQALQAEIAGHENRIDSVCDQGRAMIDEGHFASNDIQNKVQGLSDRWNQLKV